MLSALLSMLLAVNPVHAGSGKIKVNVSGNPGEIVLDGFLTGKTAPALLDEVAIGVHHVELHYGCMSGASDVEVNPGQTTVVNLRMKTYQGSGTLRLRNLPSSGTVYMDGRPVENPWEGFEAPCGGREISVEAPGFEIWSQQVVVTRDKWATLDVEMVQGELDTSVSSARKPPRGIEIEDDLSDFESDLEDLDPVEEGLFDDEEPPPLDLSTLDVGGDLDEDEYDDLDESSRAERNRRRLAAAEEREREGVSEWEPNNPSEREVARAREFEERQRLKEAGLDDDYFDVEQSRGGGNSLAAVGSSGGSRVLLGATLGMVAGGTTLAVLGHQKYKANLNTYNIVFADDCEVDPVTLQDVCSAEAVEYHTNYVWPQQKKRLAGIIVGGAGLVGMGAGIFMLDAAPSSSSVADKAADRAARAEAKAAKKARKEAEAAREAELDRRVSGSSYDDLDAVDTRSRSGSSGGTRIGLLATTGVLIAGGTGWGIYEHTQVEKFNTTYQLVWPECASGQCTQDGVNYHTEYVWPHQVNRVIAFSTAGVGVVGLGIGMLATSPTQIQIAPTQGGLHIGLSRNF